MQHADDATRFAIELRLRLEEVGSPPVADGAETDLHRRVARYVGALKGLEFAQNDVCAALRAILHEAGVMEQPETESSELTAPRESLGRQVVAWGIEAYRAPKQTD